MMSQIAIASGTSSSYFLSLPLALFCLFCFTVLAAAQTMHVALIGRRAVELGRYLRIAYEIALVCHLLLSALFMNSIGHLWFPHLFVIGRIFLPFEPLLWLNVIVIALGLALFARTKRVRTLVEVAGMVAMLPPVLAAAGDQFMWLVVIDLIVFVYSVVRHLLRDLDFSRRNISPLAAIAAIKEMPEGIVYTAPDGRILLVNDAMRRFLSGCGIVADLSDRASILETIERGGFQDNWHVTLDEANIGTLVCTRIFAIDVTEERALESRLETANTELLKTEQELMIMLDGVRDAAADEALIDMRSRVHDIIGQRLSILHRYLEDRTIDNTTLDQMKPLLTGILSDLREDTQVDQALELESIVSAFALIGVTVNIQGELPQSIELASVCTGIVREATTNAVRHGGATRVDACLETTPTGLVLTITDNGCSVSAPSVSPTGVIIEGGGLTGMRAAIQRLGGTLEVCPPPAFTLTAKFPMMEQRP